MNYCTLTNRLLGLLTKGKTTNYSNYSKRQNFKSQSDIIAVNQSESLLRRDSTEVSYGTIFMIHNLYVIM